MNLDHAGPELKSEILLSELSLFQQILLLTDGTLTKLLETYAHEEIHVVKLAETEQELQQELEVLQLSAGDRVIDRKILLQGCQSRNNWLYAESLLVPQRLPAGFHEELLTTQEPIGKLWIRHKVEMYKEIVATYQQPAGRLATYFNIDPLDVLLSRTYRALSNRQPMMLITEKFPASYYVKLETNGLPAVAGRRRVLNGAL